MSSKRGSKRLQAPPEKRGWVGEGEEQKDDIPDRSIRASAEAHQRRKQQQQRQQDHQVQKQKQPHTDSQMMRQQSSSSGASMHSSTVPTVPPIGIASSPSNVSATPSLSQQQSISVESPLPPIVQRSLGDRSNEKRKNAALEIEALIKSLHEANNTAVIQSIIAVLSKDFCTSMNSNYRKGGLIGLAATAIGLMQDTKNQLAVLLPPVLHCFDDPESRVRYYACESLYNIAKVSRNSILQHFNQIFEGLAKLFADVDVDVKNGANLLDRLMKDIVTESDSFHVEQFLPLLQTYIRRTNPYIRQLLVGWITVLDSIPGTLGKLSFHFVDMYSKFSSSGC